MQDRSMIIEKADYICTITINRPEKHNTLCPELLQDMTAVFRSLNVDPSVRAVVLRGAGEKVFCAGYDLSILPKAVQSYSERMSKGETITPEEDLLNVAVEAISGCRCPVIAMIYGPCVGAACELAVASDLRLASHTARFAIPAVRRGTPYPLDGIRRLLNVVGVGAAAELLYTAEFIDAARAKEIGLVNRVVDAQQLREATYAMARTIASNGPLGLMVTKKTIGKYLQAGGPSPADEEDLRRLAMQCVESADFQEGIRAFFEKRQPQFQGK